MTYLPYLVISVGAIAAASKLAGGSPRATFLLALFGCAFCGAHLANQPRDTYPFESWRMYTTTNVPRVYYEFVIKTDESDEFYPFELLTPLSPGPLRGYSMLAPVTWRLVQAQKACGCNRHDLVLDRLIRGLANIYEREVSRDAKSFEILGTPVSTNRHAAAPTVLYVWSAQ